MSKMSIADAAEYFGVSREAIHNRIRRGSLESVVEDGIKLVIVDSSKTARAQTKSRASSTKIQSNDSKYYKLLEEQNAKLQERVEKLEGETRSLRDQKEQMLIEERLKIEQIYRDKDEQLKNILNTLSSQFMLSMPETQNREENTLEAEIESEVVVESEVISLKKYLKKNKISEKKSKKIKAKFKKEAQRDNRIITVGKKYYINLAKYDYKNLLN